MNTNIPQTQITITVNGTQRVIDAGTTMSGLLESLNLDPRMIVVEHNMVILRERDSFSSLRLNEGDSIELVHFVGGG